MDIFWDACLRPGSDKYGCFVKACNNSYSDTDTARYINFVKAYNDNYGILLRCQRVYEEFEDIESYDAYRLRDKLIDDNIHKEESELDEKAEDEDATYLGYVVKVLTASGHIYQGNKYARGYHDCASGLDGYHIQA